MGDANAPRARVLPLTRWVRVADVEAATGLSRRAAYEHLARAIVGVNLHERWEAA